MGNKSVPLLFEKTYLHTDRDVYAKGDTLWFKAYLMNGQDNKPVNSSGTLYVELLAPDSARIISREIIRLEDGLGNGDFTLPDTLAAGNYRLRAYTNWMRNFGDNFVFEKNITILHTQATSVALAPKIIAKDKPKSKNKTAANETTLAASIITPTVNFYPEGGSLVNGISSLVAVKAEDGYGSGIAVSGSVLSSAGDTVSRFTCDSLGMGLFALLPIAGQGYQAVVELTGGGRVRYDVFQLPSALSKGLALQVRQTDSVIHATIRAAGISDSTVSLVLKHTGKTVLSQPLVLKDAQLTFRISIAALPEGISAITIYDNGGKPECERLVYIHHPNSKSAISITTDKKTYQPKEQVTVNIQTQPNASLSMAVVDAGIVPEQAGDIVSYLQLQSEVKGNIEQAKRYFDTTNVNRFKQLDLLLMTQGWRDFVWRRMADTVIRISYAAEEGISVPGRIRDENLNKMLPGLNISLYANGAKGTKMFSARSDSLGRFHFDGLMLYGKQDVTLSAVNDKGESKGAFWVDTLLPMPVRKRMAGNISIIKQDSLQSVAVKKRKEQFKLPKMSGVTQLHEVNIKERGKVQAFTVKGIGDNAFMTWGPKFDQNFNITPKDYDLKTLRWFALYNFYGAVAIGPGIQLHVEKYGMPIPILVINGVVSPFPVDTDLYYSMPIEKFKNIHLQRVVDAHNIVTYLLFLNLKDGYLTDNPGFLNAEVPGYYQARNFYKPIPTEKPSVNDYRTTIHWEPYIKTDANGTAAVNFYNAVPQTNIKVIVQGITGTGVPLVATAGYAVE